MRFELKLPYGDTYRGYRLPWTGHPGGEARDRRRRRPRLRELERQHRRRALGRARRARRRPPEPGRRPRPGRGSRRWCSSRRRPQQSPSGRSTPRARRSAPRTPSLDRGPNRATLCCVRRKVIAGTVAALAAVVIGVDRDRLTRRLKPRSARAAAREAVAAVRRRRRPDAAARAQEADDYDDAMSLSRAELLKRGAVALAAGNIYSLLDGLAAAPARAAVAATRASRAVPPRRACVWSASSGSR